MLHDILGCRDDPKDPSRGEANLGGYCNKELDALTDKTLLETDTAKRDHARDVIRNRKADEEYENFLRQVRSESYVDNRLTGVVRELRGDDEGRDAGGE